ncbi:MAG: STAS/SEC14 domain-containing protein [Emticicia sp.]
MMKKYAIIDEAQFPIIKVTFTGESADSENFPLYLSEVKQTYNHKKNLAIIFDATDAVLPSLSFQQMQAQWLKDNTQLMKDFCAGTAYIIPNIIIRNVLKAIFSFQSQPVPYIICGDITKAEEWVSKQLADLR